MRARHLHPTIPGYVRSRELADSYDKYFADSALFRHDERFMAEKLGVGTSFAAVLARRRAGYSDHSGGPPRRALDLGVGTGRHSLPLVRAGWAVTGVDLNPHMLEKTRAKFLAAGLPVDGPRPAAKPTPPPSAERPGARLLEADWHDLPLAATERFDAILLLFSGLGLVRPASRRLALLRRLRGRLAPGGQLLLHAHNALWRPPGFPAPPESALPPVRVVDTAASADPLAGEDAAGAWEPGDRYLRGYRGGDVDLFLHLFTRRELLDLLAAADYDVREFRPLSPGRGEAYRGRDPDNEANGFLVAAEARALTPPKRDA